MNALAPSRTQVASFSLASLRDIVRLYSTPIIGFRSEVKSARQNRFFTWLHLPKEWLGLDSQAGSEKFTSALAIRRCDLLPVDVKLPRRWRRVQINSKRKAGVDIQSLRRWGEQLPRQMLVHLLRPREVYHRVQRVSLVSSKICFPLGYRKLMKNVVKIVTPAARNLSRRLIIFW